MTEQTHFGVMTVPPVMLGASILFGVLALVATIFAVRRGGAIGWTLGVLAALAAIGGLGFFGFGVWGRCAGMPWTFASTVVGP